MKWAYPYGTPETKTRVLGAQGDPDAVFDALAGFGYSAVELFVRDPSQFSWAAVARALERSGLLVAAVGTGPIVTDDNLALTSHNPEVRRAAVGRAKAAVDLAAEFESQVNVGKLRGALGDDPPRSWAMMRQGLTEIADHAAVRGVVVTIEPQNSRAIDNLNTTQEAIDFITTAEHPNIKLMVDSFHAHLGDRWPVLSYVRGGALLQHVHFSDVDRLPPGRGNIDFGFHVATLNAVGYDKYVTLEIDQGDDPLATAKEAITYLDALPA